MLQAMLGFQMLYNFDNNNLMLQFKNVDYYFTYSAFIFTYCEKISYLSFFNFMDNEKSIPHFKIAPLDYSCLSVYLQNCKTTGNQILLTASSFCLKIGMSKYI